MWVYATDIADWRPVYSHSNGIFLFDHIREPGEMDGVPTLVRLDERGIAGDSTEIPLVVREALGLKVCSDTRSFGMLVPFYPTAYWTVTPTGEIVTVDGGRYAIDVHRQDGKVIRLTRDVDAFAVTAAERIAEEEQITARFRRMVPTQSWGGPGISATKPLISWLLHSAKDGSLTPKCARPVRSWRRRSADHARGRKRRVPLSTSSSRGIAQTLVRAQGKDGSRDRRLLLQ